MGTHGPSSLKVGIVGQYWSFDYFSRPKCQLINIVVQGQYTAEIQMSGWCPICNGLRHVVHA